MHGVYALLRAAELSKEWSTPLYVAQLDLKKASTTWTGGRRSMPSSSKAPACTR